MEINNISKDSSQQSSQYESKQKQKIPYSPPLIERGVILKGWVCPKCEKVWSPIVKTCLNCTPPEMGIIFDNKRYIFPK